MTRDEEDEERDSPRLFADFYHTQSIGWLFAHRLLHLIGQQQRQQQHQQPNVTEIGFYFSRFAAATPEHNLNYFFQSLFLDRETYTEAQRGCDHDCCACCVCALLHQVSEIPSVHKLALVSAPSLCKMCKSATDEAIHPSSHVTVNKLWTKLARRVTSINFCPAISNDRDAASMFKSFAKAQRCGEMSRDSNSFRFELISGGTIDETAHVVSELKVCANLLLVFSPSSLLSSPSPSPSLLTFLVYSAYLGH